MRRLGLALAFLMLASASATAQPQEADTAVADTTEALCTAWTLDITNHTDFEVRIYEYRGEVRPTLINQALKGLLIIIVPSQVRNQALLFDVRPAVLVYAGPAQGPLLGVTSPGEQRDPSGLEVPSLSPGLVLKFLCVSEDEEDAKEPQLEYR